MTGPDATEHETLGDRQVRELIERYVALSGATLAELGPHLYELKVPAADRAAFGARAWRRIAFSVEAVQTDAQAEMAIMGGMFVEQLIDAIRTRGTLYRAGFIGSANASESQHPALPVKVRRGSGGEATSRLEHHRLARLTARVVVRAGTSLEEHLVDSAVVDMSTGLLLPPDIAAACNNQLAANHAVDHAADHAVHHAANHDVAALVNKMLGNLEQQLAPELERLEKKSQQDLAHELGRIQRYYKSLLDDIDVPDKNARKVYEADRDRRMAEERDRHEVRATVHPVQLVEWDAHVQRVDWPISATNGHHGTFTAQRTLAGAHTWTFGCPTCGIGSPHELLVCRHDHVSCSACGKDCSVCASSFCGSHGIAACHVDNAPACDEHARTCTSCLMVHCSAHEAECADGSHTACVTCLAHCAICARPICDRHAELSKVDAPRGARRFCRDCFRCCEGGSNEVVGMDEVSGCASCERVVCEKHQARCAVDGKVHCSKHLRRTDRSRRLVCERDRAGCAYEPHAVMAVDEVGVCVTCGLRACETHTARCVEDARLHCRTHMSELADKPGEFACESHRSVCHVDGAAFSLAGTAACPVCDKRACRVHSKQCSACRRNVCTRDFRSDGTCVTCSRLAITEEPSDDILAAANALFESAGRAKRWRTAKDARHTVVEAELGWTRKVTFVLRHGDQRAEQAWSRSALGTKRLV